MNVRLSVLRSPLVLILLFSMLLAGVSVPTLAGPLMPAEPAASPQMAPTAVAGEATPTPPPVEAQIGGRTIPVPDAAEQVPPPGDGELTAEAKQGFVSLAVEVQSSFKAGDVLTYTYRYENTSNNETATDVAIDVTWSRFETRIWQGGQYCYPDPESCSIDNVSGPAVTPDSSAGLDQDVPDGLRVLIDELEPGESGSFSIQVRTGFNLAPISGGSINQLDSSGALYIDFVPGATKSLSEASTSTIAVGPRFVISKRSATDMPDFIFAGDEYTFVLNVGNATQPRDQTSEGQPRADAIDATNVRVRDTLPPGSAFITPTQGYDYDFFYDAEEGYVEWYIPELALEEQVELLVGLQKLDTDQDCSALNNDNPWITSDEMPINNDNEQLIIVGRGASVRVVTPLGLQRSSSPDEIAPDETSLMTFQVLNRYTRNTVNNAVENVQLTYEIPSTVSYVADSADPAPSAIDVVPGETGGIITWTFDIDTPDNPNEPIQESFTLELTGVTTGRPQDGSLYLVLDEVEPSIPTACIQRVNGVGPRVRIISEQTRINMTKKLLPELNPNLETDPGGTALIKDGDILTYTIQVSAPEDVPNIDISDFFPSQPDVRFEDISFVGDTPPPEMASDGRSMVWSQQSIQANEPLSLTYRVRVGGGEYVRYCNTARITAAPDSTRRPGDASACYTIRPQIQVSKKASIGTALPGETVAYTLTLTNDWDEARAVELIDVLGGLEFVEATSPDLGEGNYIAETRLISWTARTVQPGETVEAFVKARIPAGAEQESFRNVVLFRYIYTPLGEWRDCPGNRRSQVNVSRPSTNATVRYFHETDRPVTGLQEEFNYRIRLTNRHGVETAENVSVTHVLPAGFTYNELITGDGLVDIEPEVDTSRPDGRVILRWNLDLAAGQQTEIRFRARSGATVGAKESWLYTSADTFEVSCRETSGPASCRSDGAATARIEIRALHTLEPRAVDPLPACLEEDEELNYRISFVNNSVREYVDTTLSITVPNSLRFSGEYDGVDAPPTVTQMDQGSVVSWDDLSIPAATQRDIDIILDVVSADSFFVIRVAAESPTGLIPPENQTGVFLIDPCGDNRLYLPLVATRSP